MGLDDNLAVYQLKDNVLLKIYSSIEKFGCDEFQRHIPSDWGCQDSLNYDNLRNLKVPVTDFINVLYELKLKDAMSYLVTFIPVFIEKDLQKEVKIESGGTLKLEFKAEGTPMPTFKWYRRLIVEKQMKLLEDKTSSVLTITNFGKNDIGTYVCKATNVNKKGKKFHVESNRVNVYELTDNVDDDESNVIKEPTIVKQPVGNPKLSLGASIILNVLVDGEEPLTYEWFKDGKPVEGKNENTLVLKNILPESGIRSWIYTCLVSNVHGHVLSNPAVVGLTKKNNLTGYHAEDKVALLICNENYLYLHPLFSTLEDVTTLANCLKRENFKVIALRDLDLVEMKNAVKFFCSLLDKGVYGFFYYAGHGFEYNNQRYMQPINSLNNDSVDGSLCAEFVHAEMEKRQPRLAALIFDMCRIERERTKSVDSGQIVYKAGSKPNFIIVFATLFKKQAYGIQGAKNGIFVTYLKKYMNEKLPIQTVMNNVTGDVNADPDAGNHQHPATYSSLAEDFSLTDPILVEDELAAEIRNKLYQQITVRPLGIKGSWPDFSAIQVTTIVKPFRGCILNGLDVIVKLANFLSQFTFYPHLELENADVAVKEICNNEIPVASNETAFGLSIFNLQKLKEEVVIKISLCDKEKNILGCIDVKLGMPLIMGIDLSHSGERSNPTEECEGVE